MTSLRLVQTLESGVDWLLPSVPDHVTLCNSKGAHDAAVAEWIVALVLAMQRRLPDHQWRFTTRHSPPPSPPRSMATIES